jgi:hypothetical protein
MINFLFPGRDELVQSYVEDYVRRYDGIPLKGEGAYWEAVYSNDRKVRPDGKMVLAEAVTGWSLSRNLKQEEITILIFYTRNLREMFDTQISRIIGHELAALSERESQTPLQP